MQEIYCRQCGAQAQPAADHFCRRCGAPVASPAVPKTTNQGPASAGAGSQAPLSIFTACLITTGLIFFSLGLVMVLFLFLVKQPGDKPFVAVEMMGTPTLYPTQPPFRTALPYRTAPPYPTSTEYPIPIPYPTTGELAKIDPDPGGLRQPFAPVVPFTNSKGCEIRIKNQYPGLDTVILLEDVNTKTVTTSVFVRASDTFSKNGVSAGTYFVYVALGQDWDNFTGRFLTNAFYLRFKEKNVFETCSTGYSGRYQYLEITLNASGGAGSEMINVPPGTFPSISP